MNNQKLADVAERMHAAYARTKNGRAEWVNGTMELAAALLEAKKMFPKTNEFSEWLGRNGFGYITHQNRAALVGFAKHPVEMRAILETTHRFSWEMIWQKEAPASFRVTSPRNSATKMSADPHTKAAVRREATREQREAEVRRRLREEVFTGTLRGLSAEEIGVPELANDPHALREAFGPVRILTKTQVEEMAVRDRVADWIKLVNDARKLATAEVPEDIYVWAERPLKRQKLDRWLTELEKIAGIVAQIRSRLSHTPVEVRRTA